MPRRKLTDEEKAARREKTAATRAKNEAEQREKDRLRRRASDLEDLRSDRKVTTVFGEPTRYWEVGERVQYGNHENAEVLEVADEQFYLVRIWGMKKEQHGSNYYPYETIHWEPWWRLEDEIDIVDRGAPLSYRDDVRIIYMNSTISGLIHMHYNGMDYEPEYQRGHVWTMKQRVALIDSIFNNIDIGKFAIINRGYDCIDEPYREMLDGKQRLTTLVMFYEDRFEYCGKVYSRMHGQDQGHFEHYQALTAETEGAEMTREQKLRYFLKLNTAGAPQDQEHIDKIKDLWVNVREEYRRK